MTTATAHRLTELQAAREAARIEARRTADAFRATLTGYGPLDASQLALLDAHTAAYRLWLDAHEAVKAHLLVFGA